MNGPALDKTGELSLLLHNIGLSVIIDIDVFLMALNVILHALY